MSCRMKRIDLTGNRYGRLTVVEPGDGGKWVCQCNCGNSTSVLRASLVTGNTKSCGCMRGRMPDETGKRYGRFVVLRRVKNRGFAACWECVCDCGKIAVVRGYELRSRNSQSCGCLRIDRLRKANTLPLGHGARNKAIGTMKANARNRGHVWKLSEAFVHSLLEAPCHYCGVAPANLAKGTNGDFAYNGLDRIDSSKGYTQINVVPCCGQCNHSKRHLSAADFIRWAKRVAAHHT